MALSWGEDLFMLSPFAETNWELISKVTSSWKPCALIPWWRHLRWALMSDKEMRMGTLYLPSSTNKTPKYLHLHSRNPAMPSRISELGEILYIAPPTVSRGTLCWTATEEQTSTKCVIKDAWRSTPRISEADLWRVASTNYVLGCLKVEHSSHNDDKEASWGQTKPNNIRRGLGRPTEFRTLHQATGRSVLDRRLTPPVPKKLRYQEDIYSAILHEEIKSLSKTWLGLVFCLSWGISS